MQSMRASLTVTTPATLHYLGLKDLDVGELKATHLPSRPTQVHPPHQMGYKKKATQHSTASSILYEAKTNNQKGSFLEPPFCVIFCLCVV
ncbi:hypothetical protein J4Q44_G00252990 [Coregonus suidteri]|uniref:Uncharacterized protein n=1 Tax=Coregonus suidteri TaxID=861788 RepID=A0AAN8QNT4_9TELE